MKIFSFKNSNGIVYARSFGKFNVDCDKKHWFQNFQVPNVESPEKRRQNEV